MKSLMKDPDNAIRYWGVMGALMRGKDEVTKLDSELRKSLNDASPHVRIAAAEALGLYGTEQDVRVVMPILMELANAEKRGIYSALHALNAIDSLGAKALPWKAEILALPTVDGAAPERVGVEYIPKLLRRFGETLGTAASA